MNVQKKVTPLAHLFIHMQSKDLLMFINVFFLSSEMKLKLGSFVRPSTCFGRRNKCSQHPTA